MKRYTLRILLCLFLGVVTTVASAWLAPLIPLSVKYSDGVDLSKEPSWGYSSASWLAHEWLLFGEDNDTNLIFDVEEASKQRVIPDWVDMEQIRSLKGQSFCQYYASGWPYRCFYSKMCFDGFYNHENYDLFESAIVVFEPNSTWKGGYVLPYRPLAVGLLVNLSIWTAVWFLVLSIPSFARKTLRTKRGRCPLCSYNLRGEFESGCSECGWRRTESE